MSHKTQRYTLVSPMAVLALGTGIILAGALLTIPALMVGGVLVVVVAVVLELAP